MTAEDVLVEARRRGIKLTPRPDGMLVFEPTDRVDSEFVEALRRHKPRILRMLKTYRCRVCDRFRFREPGVVCYWCRRAAEMEARA